MYIIREENNTIYKAMEISKEKAEAISKAVDRLLRMRMKRYLRENRVLLCILLAFSAIWIALSIILENQ